MNISDLLGAVLQSGLTPSSNDRLRNAFGGGSGNPLEGLGSIFGGRPAADPSKPSGGGLGDVLSGMLGGGGGLGGMLGSVLNEAGRKVGGIRTWRWGGWEPWPVRFWAAGANPSGAPWAAGSWPCWGRWPSMR